MAVSSTRPASQRTIFRLSARGRGRHSRAGSGRLLEPPATVSRCLHQDDAESVWRDGLLLRLGIRCTRTQETGYNGGSDREDPGGKPQTGVDVRRATSVNVGRWWRFEHRHPRPCPLDYLSQGPGREYIGKTMKRNRHPFPGVATNTWRVKKNNGQSVHNLLWPRVAEKTRWGE